MNTRLPRYVVSIALLTISLLTWSATQGLAQEPQYVVRDLDGSIRYFAVAQADQAVAAVYASGRSTIVYVHGRAAGDDDDPETLEPGKSLARVIPRLTQDTDSVVLMVNWPGSDAGGKLGFPEKQARAGATALAEVIKSIARVPSRPKTVLLSHSLGGFAVEQMIRGNLLSSTEDGVIENLLLTSAANEGKTAAQWLSQARFARRVFVTVNDDDWVLRAAGFKKRDGRLGKKIQSMLWNRYPLAKGVTYIEVSKAEGLKHRYFLSTGYQEAPAVGAVLNAILRGANPAFPEAGWKSTDRKGAQVNYLR